MMLKKHVVFMRSATNATKDVALHEAISIGSESINNLWVVSSAWSHSFLQRTS
jgi:hypothetical protein